MMMTMFFANVVVIIIIIVDVVVELTLDDRSGICSRGESRDGIP